ncbi:hypothetical protein MJ_1579 [Methanocaldococcus jannaschii DSM 2661]|uniref:Uncharacterized protein MJ1579 n=1 Tax=Methanocaldococcus jannaschii (strain ATCC 43067 / DSM 2661 / JAL-1 / JCM 10045 / NBRC 100440) TaxID=243232 RepID=Y1579_METJA|nr:hypothetical protein [Methanocaldococcus jannaschii]Q58974.1 RecName: Full=Uncharacterized protein MJ1579 [Methanocaldococcus jannaschii DSM 2661]AAB99607.1 hypothetical protein MJ_1579 [Methanocaldococcus jannaschii DSM 2661]
MNQRKEIELLMFDVLPYMANMEFIKELLESVNSLEELEQKVRELLEKETDITKKTDLKILLEKIEERKNK